MSLLFNRSPRILLSAVAIVLLISIGANSIGAAPPQQSSPTPTPQTTKPMLLTDPVPDPKQEGVMWFAQTGHTLRGAFLDYWNKYGGLAQFGYPFTEEFFEEVGPDYKQYQVQYFERNRFELHPENRGTQYEVLLGALGLDFRKADPTISPIAGATYFSETGHNLSGKFKEYWDTHGGLFVHGFPITEAVTERSTNGKEYLVQWFERSRFELHPENAGSAYEVLLGLLGKQLSEKKGFPYGWYPPYGHAADWSWVAGHYYWDTFMFPGAGCDTVRYVQSNNREKDVTKGTSIRPIGSGWSQPSPYIRTKVLLVAFGTPRSLDDFANEPQPSESCEKPRYIVSDVRGNPMNQP